MILQKFELCKVQLTHGANQLYIHGNEKLNCLGSTGRSRSQIKSFTVCFLYANSSCRLRLPCKGYNSIRTLPGHSAAMSQCAADWAGAPLPWRGGWWCFTHHPPALLTIQFTDTIQWIIFEQKLFSVRFIIMNMNIQCKITNLVVTTPILTSGVLSIFLRIRLLKDS